MGDYEVELEFSRNRDIGDPYGFSFEPQGYRLRLEGGRYDGRVFLWDETLLEDLARLSKPRPDPRLLPKFGKTLADFLPKHWRVSQAESLLALPAGRRVVLTLRSAAAELYALPWELLLLGQGATHLAQTPRCLIRYEWPGTTTRPWSPDPPPEGDRIDDEEVVSASRLAGVLGEFASTRTPSWPAAGVSTTRARRRWTGRRCSSSPGPQRARFFFGRDDEKAERPGRPG